LFGLFSSSIAHRFVLKNVCVWGHKRQNKNTDKQQHKQKKIDKQARGREWSLIFIIIIIIIIVVVIIFVLLLERLLSNLCAQASERKRGIDNDEPPLSNKKDRTTRLVGGWVGEMEWDG
jgi:hypothetical protein